MPARRRGGGGGGGGGGKMMKRRRGEWLADSLTRLVCARALCLQMVPRRHPRLLPALCVLRPPGAVQDRGAADGARTLRLQ
jgi:hypothetical protein